MTDLSPARPEGPAHPRGDDARANERLAGIVNGARAAIIGQSPTGVIESWNIGAQELYGYGAEEMIGRNIEVLAPPELRLDLARALSRVAQGQRIDGYEALRLTSDGRSIDAEASLSPILVDGAIAGIAAVVHGTARRSRLERELNQANGKLQASVAELEQRERDMATLATLNEHLQACNTSAEAYPLIAAAAEQLFARSSGGFAISVTRGHDLETVAQWGEELAMAPSFKADDCWGLRCGQLHHFSGAATPACQHFSQPPAAPYLCLPLATHGETIGLLTLAPRTEASATRTQRLLEALGQSMKLALANLQLRERLSAQALRDSLTGLHNRHSLADMLPRELQRAERHGSPLSAVMLDIDHFKKFNDTYGHDAGDEVLRSLGRTLATAIRGSDLAFRFGGEEFLLVLPDCNAEEARQIADQIRDLTRSHAVPFQGRRLPKVTVSAGVAEFPRQAGADELVGACDKAMLQAKEAGRDCTRIFDEALPDATARPTTAAAPGALSTRQV